MANYPGLKIRAGSKWFYRSWGKNSRGGIGWVSEAGVPFDHTNSTAFMTLARSSGGPALIARQAMTWTVGTPQETPASIDRWQYDVPATLCESGGGPWLAIAEVFDVAGLTGELLATFYNLISENDSVGS